MKINITEERPWGRFFVLFEDENCKVKKIEVESGHRLSYQYHQKRSEIWIFISGEGSVILNDKKINCKKGEIIQIPQGAKHRIENESIEKLIFIEVQTGSYFGEDDIIRIEDDYKRA